LPAGEWITRQVLGSREPGPARAGYDRTESRRWRAFDRCVTPDHPVFVRLDGHGAANSWPEAGAHERDAARRGRVVRDGTASRGPKDAAMDLRRDHSGDRRPSCKGARCTEDAARVGDDDTDMTAGDRAGPLTRCAGRRTDRPGSSIQNWTQARGAGLMGTATTGCVGAAVLPTVHGANNRILQPYRRWYDGLLIRARPLERSSARRRDGFNRRPRHRDRANALVLDTSSAPRARPGDVGRGSSTCRSSGAKISRGSRRSA
jgi:hypothetical protein